MNNNQKTITFSLVTSILFHFAFLYTCTSSGPNGDGDSDGKHGRFTNEEKVNILPKFKSDISAPCENSFGGIGVEYDYLQVITNIPEGNPAFNAGMKIGDQIVTPLDYIRGELGTAVTVEVMRNNTEHLTFTMIRDKICQGT